jgi:D-alanyl-D-alanine carboxypeptidase (penicillin-binding protein 5/6)
VRLVAAVLGTPTETDRDLETVRLLDYGFSLYSKRTPVRRGEVLASPEIRFTGGELRLRAPRTIAVGLRRGQRLQISVRRPDQVEGPIRRGAILGRAAVSVDGLRVATVPLRAARAVPEATVLDRVRSFAEENLLWLALALSGILVGAVLMRRLTR